MILPIIHSVSITNFSLYKLQSELNLNINEGVFCLAGANGLGKSTFISILSYAITGIVVNPRKNFTSINRIPKFFSISEKFASEYFDGRIEESKRDLANVSIEFTIDTFRYKITRNFFDTTGLESFSRIDTTSQIDTVEQGLSSTKLLSEYKRHFIHDSQIESFDQFAFIHSFVLTFDESKQLLFWDDAIMTRVLYMFFGVDVQKAELADDLRKDIERHGSNTRNIQWAIKQANDNLNALVSNMTTDSPETATIEEALRVLKEKDSELEELAESLETKQYDLKNCLLKVSDITLKISTLKSSFESNFNNLYGNEITVERDEQVVNLLRVIAKKILNDENADVSSELENIKTRIRIVCQNKKTTPNSIEILKKLDEDLASLNKELKELLLKKKRLEEEIEVVSKTYQESIKLLDDYKSENEKIIAKAATLNPTDYAKEIDSIKTFIIRKEEEKAKETLLKNEKSEKLAKIEKEIKENYLKAEEQFVTKFKTYASSFIGLDIDIELKASKSKGLGLALHVNNAERKEQYQLSESQRYFLDIALRFALIEYVSSSTYILIDTPEGSLDIAYESRAGKMFADFVLKGYNVIMTANINSSQLLIQMARKCKKQKMKIERMTDWTILSEVQQQEHQIIEEAFDKIEQELQAEQ